LILEQLLGELAEISGLAAYSLFQLPEESIQRQRIYEKILSQQKDLHFAVEGFCASTQEECERVETLWRIRLTLPHCTQLDL